MAVCEMRWKSEVLDKQVAMNVILPDSAAPPFATFYLLHGLSDDYSTWTRRTRIEDYAAAYPFIIVMPDGFRGFFTNNDAGPAYAKYIAEELPTIVERTFPARTDRASRCIGGLSMGGYGALRIALGYPRRFISATSHSGAVMNGSRSKPPDRFPDAMQIFGPRPGGTDHDLLHLAKLATAQNIDLHLRLDCGNEDHLLEDNRIFHRELLQLGIPHEYEEFPGQHSWDYWDAHVRQALAFHARVMSQQGSVK